MWNEHKPIKTSNERLFPIADFYEYSLTFTTRPVNTEFPGDVGFKSIREASC